MKFSMVIKSNGDELLLNQEMNIDEMKELVANQKDSLQLIKNDSGKLVDFVNSPDALKLVQSIRGIIKEASKPLNPKPVEKEEEKSEENSEEIIPDMEVIKK